MNNVKYQDLKREYPGKVCVCRPHLREVKRHRVVSWLCLEAVDRIEAARESLARFDQDGMTDAVAISASEELVIEGGLAARYFRVFFGMQ